MTFFSTNYTHTHSNQTKATNTPMLWRPTFLKTTSIISCAHKNVLTFQSDDEVQWTVLMIRGVFLFFPGTHGHLNMTDWWQWHTKMETQPMAGWTWNHNHTWNTGTRNCAQWIHASPWRIHLPASWIQPATQHKMTHMYFNNVIHVCIL